MYGALPNSLKNIQTYYRQREFLMYLDRRIKCAYFITGILCEMRGTKETGSGLLLATLGYHEIGPTPRQWHALTATRHTHTHTHW